jgi:hypothetical protein
MVNHLSQLQYFPLGQSIFTRQLNVYVLLDSGIKNADLTSQLCRRSLWDWWICWWEQMFRVCACALESTIAVESCLALDFISVGISFELVWIYTHHDLGVLTNILLIANLKCSIVKAILELNALGYSPSLKIISSPGISVVFGRTWNKRWFCSQLASYPFRKLQTSHWCKC